MKLRLHFACVAVTVVLGSCGQNDASAPPTPKPQAKASESIAASHPDPAITAAEVRERLREPREDYLFNTISMLVTRRHDIEIVTLLEDVWTGKKSRHPELAWPTLEKPIVRVALAQTLAQVHPRDKGYRAFLLQAVDHNDKLVHTHAILALGLLGDDALIPTLEKLVRSNERSKSSAAITSLASMQRTSANEVLERLLKEYADDAAKSKAIEAALKMFRGKS